MWSYGQRYPLQVGRIGPVSRIESVERGLEAWGLMRVVVILLMADIPEDSEPSGTWETCQLHIIPFS